MSVSRGSTDRIRKTDSGGGGRKSRIKSPPMGVALPVSTSAAERFEMSGSQMTRKAKIVGFGSQAMIERLCDHGRVTGQGERLEH